MLSEEGRVVKRELENFNQAKRRLRNLQNELESWRRMDGALKSASLEQRSDGGEVTQYAERRLIRMQELEGLISDAIDKALALEDIFFKNIVLLDITSQNLLMERYMTGKSLKRIIRELNYSERQIYRKYDVIFENLAKNQKDGSKCQY